MQLQGQTSEVAAAIGWISSELFTVLQVLIFLVLGYVATGVWKRRCSPEPLVHPKKIDADDNEPSEQPATVEREELMPPSPTKTAAQTRFGNAQERKRSRKAKEAEKSQKPVAEASATDATQNVKANAKKAEKKSRKAQLQKDVQQKLEACPEAPASDSEVKVDSEDGQTICTPTSSANFDMKSDSEASPSHLSTASTAQALVDIDMQVDSCEASPGSVDLGNTLDEKPNNAAIDEIASSDIKLQEQDECFGLCDHVQDDQEQLADSKDGSFEPSGAALDDSFGSSGLAVDDNDQQIDAKAAQAIENIEHEIVGLDTNASDEVDESMEKVFMRSRSLSDGDSPCIDAVCSVNFDNIIDCDNVSERSFGNIKTPSEPDSLPQHAGAPVMWCSMPQSPSGADGNSTFPVMGPQIGGWMAVAMPAECAPAGALDGLWVNDANERILIDKLKIMFDSGITWDMTMHSLTEISVMVDDEKFTAELDNSGCRLLWSDGDVWTFSGQAQQPSEESQQWTPEAMSELPCMSPGDLSAFSCMMVPIFPENAQLPPPPKNQVIPRDAKKWEICWDWKKKGCCPRGASCDWYHPAPESHIF